MHRCVGGEAMVTGITMLKVIPAQEKPIYYQLKSNERIQDIYHISGAFDFLLILYADGLDCLNKFLDSIREIRGVAAARTILVGRDRSVPGLDSVKVPVC